MLDYRRSHTNFHLPWICFVWAIRPTVSMMHCLPVSRGSMTPLYCSSKGFGRDEHIPDLLLFPPDLQFVDDPLYHEGKIILQDKASCIPAFVLSPPATDRTVTIDATAAPGNKTSHLSALMQNKGKVRPMNSLPSRSTLGRHSGDG